MNIPEILDKITQAILHFDLKKFLDSIKPGFVIAVLIGIVIIIIGAIFSLIPQF